jgi:O-antigen ligase
VGTYYSQGVTRLKGVTGLFAHPNSLGGVTAANLPFFYYLIGVQKSLKSKILISSLMAIAAAVIVLTNSRTALIAIVSFFGFVWLKSKVKLFSIIPILLCMIIIWHFTPPETKERYLTIGKAANIVSGDSHKKEAGVSSMAHRWMLIKVSFEVFLENPVIGVGVGCFQPLNGLRNNIWLPTHCLYTEILAELGILGFLVFSYLIWSIFQNIKLTRTLLSEIDSDVTFLSNILSAMSMFLILRLVVGLFGNDLYTNYWWMAGGLSVVLLRIAKQKHEEITTGIEKNNR